MSMILVFTDKWNRWYHVLRYRKRFGLLDSMRHGLLLAVAQREVSAMAQNKPRTEDQ